MSSSYLIGLMAIGFLMLIVGWPWWISIGVIILSLALLAGSESEQIPIPEQRPMIAAARAAQPEPAKKPDAAKGERYRDWRDDEKEEEKSGFFVEDMKWSPTAYADGILGVNPMKGDFGGSVGGRTGAFTLDMGPIRFKDDFRFRLYGDGADKAFDMCRTEAGPLHAWDFRTRKPLFVEPTAQFKPIVKSPDDALDPGLGVPWAKKSDKK